MTSVGDDDPNVWERKAQAAKQPIPGFAVRDIGRLNSARNRQSEGINKDVSLAPLHLLVPVKTAHTAALGRLHRLPIHDDDGRAFGAACGNPRPLVQRPLQLGPHTLGSPPTEIVIDRAARRIFAWQPPPLAAGAEQMEDRVDDGAQIGRPLPSTG